MGSWQSRFGANRYTKPAPKPTTARPQWRKPVTTRKPFTTLKPTPRYAPKPTTKATTMNRWSPTKPRTTTRTTTRFSFMEEVVETTQPFVPTTQPVAQVNFNQNLFTQRTNPSTTSTTYGGPVAVNECLTGSHRCDPSATCYDQLEVRHQIQYENHFILNNLGLPVWVPDRLFRGWLSLPWYQRMYDDRFLSSRFRVHKCSGKLRMHVQARLYRNFWLLYWRKRMFDWQTHLWCC